MAEVVVSSLLPVIFEKLTSSALKSIVRYKGIGDDIKKWESWLKDIQNVLTDASEKEITNDSVKEWLKDFQHLAYDLDDLLDGWATEAMDREFTHHSEATTSKVRKLIPTCCTNFSRNTAILDELDSINRRFEDLFNRKNKFGLKVEGKPRPKKKDLTSSVVDPSRIVGRQVEKKVWGDEPFDQKYSIVPVVGMGGVGKTTLAKLLYNEEKVNDHFELKAWVVVSDKFDSFAISKTIYENVAGETKTFSDLNLVQVDLVKQLRGKRFLLVLDDIWSVRDREWENLVEPFNVCATGSKIIITTRKEQLLTRLGCKDLSPLQSLSHDDAMSLFARHALHANDFDSKLSLKPHGEAIVKKCGGLPLALIALGTSLKTKEDEDSWRAVVDSKIWTLKDGGGILPALRISYLDLSACLKQMFAYCSLFPKDFSFDKDELVRLWMAEGFFPLSTSNDPTKESLGHTYFDDLLSRSFFQRAPDNKSLFVMHDMMNDLATSVAGEFFLRFDNETEKGIKEEAWKKHRHMSFVHETYVTSKKFKTFEKAKSLRTFLATSLDVIPSYTCFYLSDKILAEVLPNLPLLRVLSLSNFEISEVPESIGSLRHLRYLNLSYTKITNLPENVCTLYNLQTLILCGCYMLYKLPNSFSNLQNLLTSLEVLHICDCNNMDCCSCPDSIETLGVYRCSSITKILLPSGGQKLKSFEVTDCKKLLEREWGGQKMNNRIKHVRMRNWPNLKSVNELSYLVHLTELSIVSCTNLESFPYNELVKLTSLTNMEIVDCPRMDTCFPGGVWPPNLYRLEIGNLKKPISKWGTQNFPPSLKRLHLYGNNDGASGCRHFSDLLPSSLDYLIISGFENLESLSDGLQKVTSLKDLYISDCPNLKKLSYPQHLQLQHLEFEECPNMMDLPEDLLPSLLSLTISSNCPKLKERCSGGGNYCYAISYIPRYLLYFQTN